MARTSKGQRKLVPPVKVHQLRSKGPAREVLTTPQTNSSSIGPPIIGISSAITVEDCTAVEGTTLEPQTDIGAMNGSPRKLRPREQIADMEAIVVQEERVENVFEVPVAGPTLIDADNHVTVDMVATVINSDAPPTNPALPNNEGLAQNEANIPERPVLGDQDTDNSSLEDDFFAPPPPRAKLLPMPKSKFDPSLLADGRQRIKARGESLDTPFVHISDAIRNSLQDAKRIQGGPKQLLARLERLARRVTVKRVVGDIDSEVEEDPNSSEDFLECIRCMMVVEATMLKSGSKRPIGNKGNGARKPCRIGSIRVPPGGELNVDGRSGESPQAIEQLEIKEYSNEVYWRFAPYLDPEFRAQFEELYRPNSQGLYGVEKEDLEKLCSDQESTVVSSLLAAKRAPVDDTGPASSTRLWELHILRHLMDLCAPGVQELVSEDGTEASEDSDFESEEMTNSGRGLSMKKTNISSTTMQPIDENDAIEKEREGKRTRSVELNESDLKRVADLWNNVVNPACLQFEKETGKPAEAMREAIAGVFERRVKKFHQWNAWQRVWWNKMPTIEDKTILKRLHKSCRSEYNEEVAKLKSGAALDDWIQKLECSVAQLSSLKAQKDSAQRVIEYEDEFVRLASRAARDHVHALFFVCSVNPSSIQAQAMSGIGVGSQEMRSVLVDNGQLPQLRLILNDLKTKVGAIEVENRNAGKLPPAFGEAGMLQLEGSTGPPLPGTFTNHKLFTSKAPHRSAKARPQTTSSMAHKTSGVHSRGEGGSEDEDISEDEDDNGNNNILSTLPSLPPNADFVKAVSETKMASQIKGWGMPDNISKLYKLFLVLVEPPQGLILDKIEGLPEYLSKLLNSLLKLPENGIRSIASHCWRLISGLCHRTGRCPMNNNWKYILHRLEISQKRAINWCPSIAFPSRARYPKSRGAQRSMVTMFFNPESALRLRLECIDGAITDDTSLIINPTTTDIECLACTKTKVIVHKGAATKDSPIRPSPVVVTSAPNDAATAVPSIMPTAITTGIELTASSIPPANGLLSLPVHQFISPFDVSISPSHFASPNPFPTGSGGLSNEPATSDLPPGTFEPYYYLTDQPDPPSNNHALSANSSTAAQGSAEGTNRLKRSRLQGLSEENKRPKRQKGEGLVMSAAGQQEAVYQVFQVGHSEIEGPVINLVGYVLADETSHSQSHVVISSSMTVPVANEEPTTDIALSLLLNIYPCPPGMAHNEYLQHVRAKLASQLPATGI